MTVYMVERDLPGITMEQLAGAQQAAIATSQRFSAEGQPVRYIPSWSRRSTTPRRSPIRGWWRHTT